RAAGGGAGGAALRRAAPAHEGGAPRACQRSSVVTLPSLAGWPRQVRGGLRPGILPSAMPAGTLPRGGMVDLAAEWSELLHAEAAGYAEVAIANLKREFPSDVRHTMAGPGDFPFRPRVRTPVFYGSLDWHSAVEMHWLLM